MSEKKSRGGESMNVYVITSGQFEDYYFEILIHEKQFKKKEFADLCKIASDKLSKESPVMLVAQIKQTMIDMFGFVDPRTIECYCDTNDPENVSFTGYDL